MGQQVMTFRGKTLTADAFAEMSRKLVEAAPGEIPFQIERIVKVEDDDLRFDLNQGKPPHRIGAS